MKMTKLIITGVSVTLALGMTTAQAKEGGKGGKKGGKKPNPEKRAAILERFDADGDGELSDSEKATAKETMKSEREEIRAAVLEKFDADGDGELSKTEREGVREWVKENYPDAIPPRPRKGKKGKRDGQASE